MANPQQPIRTASGRVPFVPDNGADEGAPTVLLSSNAENVSSPAATEASAQTLSDDQYFDSTGHEIAEEGPTNAEARDVTTAGFEPINPGDQAILTRLALSRTKTNLSRTQSVVSARTPDLERKDTLDGLELGDEALNPQSEKFDLHKWIRMILSLVDEEGIKVARAGVTFQNLNVSGRGSALNTQPTVGSLLTSPLRVSELFVRKPVKQILHSFNGLMKSGELLIVLGRPGSGCSTLLKTICGETHGLKLDEQSKIHYNGISQQRMMKEFKGEVVYNQEVDKHFPHLTVGETLEHAAAMRMPSRRPGGWSRKELVKHVTEVIMAVYGLSHTYNTKVGNDYVRGVSGGERKRVSIAELALAGAAVVAWDNSTRGLDSATALKFAKSLRQSANLAGSTHAVAIYQASQAIYDLFDKAVVLYEGREIFFGKASEAKAYFERMGWSCPSRQTTGDFLTSITNPVERIAREGYENKVPRTAEDFEQYWQSSPEFESLQREIKAHEEEFPLGDGDQLANFRQMKADQQAKHTRAKSPYVVSAPMQVKLNMKRAWQRIWNDKPATLSPLIGNIVLSLIIGSVFYNTPTATSGFTAFGAVLFFAVLINALTAISEINSLYAQRPIVEKHKSYAFYHPWTEAIAGFVLDIPIKFLQAVVFNIIIYFLSGLRREPAQFFIFFLFNFIATFVMSAMFRTVAAVTKTVSQAMSVAGVLVLAIVIYTGFVAPIPYMKVWFSWIRWINPVFYAFEALVANQFHGVEFACSQFIPAYSPEVGDSFVCSSTGAVAGQRTVNGDAYIAAQYTYTYSHVWRNFGILIAFLIGFLAIYLVAVELNSSTSSTAEVLVFRRGHIPQHLKEAQKPHADVEEGSNKEQRPAQDKEGGESPENVIPPQTDIFTWKHVNYDIEIKGEPRKLLDDVSGWVKPGTLTALMGTSGAGKTTLLDVLAQRTSVGVVTGSMFVNGASLDSSFERKTGYVQQQDLHLDTATVRESLRFSAMLRQPKSVSKKEKYDYVEDVIKMLNMEEFAEAVVGQPGEGLNVEQRKLLTIGVELAAKPKLLLFLDEPTSGLDSQSSWAICAFLRKLADSGQAVLCTIHQPSAILFQQFDRLLFLRKGGKTVYFGDIGENSRTLLDYFEANGARHCADEENPAEYMLEIAAEEKWVQTWRNSKEAAGIQTEIDAIHDRQRESAHETDENDASAHSEFAMPFSTQLYEVTYRVFQQYWRMPSYIFAKLILSTASGLFIGFSFYDADTTLQGMQTVLYSLFMLTTIFSTIVQQIIPQFVTQRSLYEVRERPSKAYSWKAFLIANIIVEIPYQIVAAILTFATFYYPVVGIQSSERQGLVLLFSLVFLIYASTFAHMVIAALPDAQTAGSIVTLLFSMTLIFNGVMQPPSSLPGFWIFMYRVSPLTYWVSGIAASMLHGREVVCSAQELSVFNPPAGQTCRQYLQTYLSAAPGTLQNPDATSDCGYCSLSVADEFLSSVGISWDDRWRNFGLIWAYVAFNIFIAVMMYYFFRVRPNKKTRRVKSRSQKDPKDAEKEARDEADNRSDISATETEKSTPGNGTARRPSLYHSVTQSGTQIVGSVLNYNESRVRTNHRNLHVF